jgi:hypothetical protein
MHTETIQKIIEAKTAAGENACLWLQADAGDCILWGSEEESQNDNGANAVGRWQLTPAEVEELNDSDVRIDERN